MSEAKKVWFHRVIGRLWIPISWEGWAYLVVTPALLYGIRRLNGLSLDDFVSLSGHWPVLLESGVVIALAVWVTRGRVRN